MAAWIFENDGALHDGPDTPTMVAPAGGGEVDAPATSEKDIDAPTRTPEQSVIDVANFISLAMVVVPRLAAPTCPSPHKTS